MTDYFIKLTNIDFDGDGTSDPIEYHFNLVGRIARNSSQSFSTIEANPVTLSQNVSITHKQQVITIDWLLYDDGSDKSSGTFASSGITDSRIADSDGDTNKDVVTIREQDIFLEDYIRNNTLGAQWKLFGGKFSDPDGDGTDEGTPVVVENYSSSVLSEEPLRMSGSMKLKVGERV